MKRHPALIALSRDHHTALVWAKRAQRGDAADQQTLMTQLVIVFDRELEPHFMTEEKDLLPALQDRGQHELVRRTLADHRSLRNEIERVRTGGCTEAVEIFGKLLERHVRFEERELFAAAETLLFPVAANAMEEDRPLKSTQ